MQATDNAPTMGKSRIQSIDTLRGVALCGILLMNIIAFGLSFSAYFNPVADGATEGINLTTYMTMDILVEGSMRTIFSMLFGAGVLLFTNKPESEEARTRSLWYRRTWLLVAFGMIDAYLLLWVGDILYVYGMVGLLLYVVKDYPPQKLIFMAATIIIVAFVFHFSSHIQIRAVWQDVVEIEAQLEGGTATAEQQEVLDRWEQIKVDQQESLEVAAQDIEVRSAGYGATFIAFLPINLFLHTVGLVFGTFWDALCMMLIGMAFMKWRVFDASHSLRFYGMMMVLGFGIGLPVNYYEVATFVETGFATHWNVSSLRPTYDIGRLGMAIGYIGLVMTICKLELFTRLRSALSAVGQMALSNYLAHSVICAVLFIGFGWIGQLERYQIYYVVLAIWIFQLITSPLWLKHFRFGPVEWLWRCLTYGKRQPFRIAE